MTTNSYSPPWRSPVRIRRLDKRSLLAWSSTILAAFAGLSGAIDQRWAILLFAFCAGMGVAFACRSATAACRCNATDGQPASTHAHSALQSIWQDIDRHRDLLHLLQERKPPADARLRPNGRERDDSQK